MIGNIYRIINNINGKSYIGKTYQNIEKRFKEHIQDSKKERCKNRPLYRAMNKYGIANFSIELIGCFEENILEEKEIEYIKLYNSYVKDNGYNATLGGDSKRYYEFSEKEVIDKYNELKCVLYVAEYFNCSGTPIKIILINNNISINHDVLGESTKDKYSVSVLQLDLNNNFINEFDSFMSASRYLQENNISNIKDCSSLSSKISLCCRNKRKTAYGFIWQYKIQ